jgi:hypothetical protein
MKRWIARAATGAAMCLTACRGPEPHVASHDFRVSANGDRLWVEAVVENRSPGDGQISLQAEVRDRASGALVAREAKEVELTGRARDSFVIEVPLSAKARANLAGLSVDVEAEYPIE